MYKSYTPVLTSTDGRYRLVKYYERYLPGERRFPKKGYLPVVFFPGNAGSYEQVASLAAESARSFRRKHPALNVDLEWYSLDFGGQLSALDASVLEEQSHFAVQCLRWLHQRQTEHRLLLVGHSFGGIVAQSVIIRLAEVGESEMVLLLLAVATPHASPVFMTQLSMSRLYARLYRTQTSVPIISLTGGKADYQITSSFVQIPGDVSFPWMQINTIDVAGVWAAVNHQRLLVCNALIQRLSLMLLEVANGSLLNSKWLEQQDLETLVHKHLTALQSDSLSDNTGKRSRHEVGSYDADRDSSDLFIVNADKIRGSSRHSCFAYNTASKSSDDVLGTWVFATGVSPFTGFRVWLSHDEAKTTNHHMKQPSSEEITSQAHVASYALPNARPLPVPRNMSVEVIKGRDYLTTASWLIFLEAKRLKTVDQLHFCLLRQRTEHDLRFAISTIRRNTARAIDLHLWNLLWPSVLNGDSAWHRNGGSIVVDVNTPAIIGLSPVQVRIQWEVQSEGLESQYGVCWHPVRIPKALLSSLENASGAMLFLLHPACNYNIMFAADLAYDFLNLTWFSTGQVLGLVSCWLISRPSCAFGEFMTVDVEQSWRGRSRLWTAFTCAVVAAALRKIGTRRLMLKAGIWTAERDFGFVADLSLGLFVLSCSVGFEELLLLLIAKFWLLPSVYIMATVLKRFPHICTSSSFLADLFLVVASALLCLYASPLLVYIVSVEIRLLDLTLEMRSRSMLFTKGKKSSCMCTNQVCNLHLFSETLQIASVQLLALCSLLSTTPSVQQLFSDQLRSFSENLFSFIIMHPHAYSAVRRSTGLRARLNNSSLQRVGWIQSWFPRPIVDALLHVFIVVVLLGYEFVSLSFLGLVFLLFMRGKQGTVI